MTREVTAYERELGERLGVEHVVAVSSGTAALQTALDAVAVGPGDEVLLPALSVVMSAAPILHLGARAVCVDCNAAGTDFDYDDLARKVSERTAAVLPVHLWARTIGLRHTSRAAIPGTGCQIFDDLVESGL